jgi:hypothetical protein
VQFGLDRTWGLGVVEEKAQVGSLFALLLFPFLFLAVFSLLFSLPP